MRFPLVAYFKSNFTEPNLIVDGPHGIYDLTATFANIEKNFGSKTDADEKELKRRRAEKEQLKLECVRLAISGVNQEEKQEDGRRATYWLLPPSHFHNDCYTYFTDPQIVADFKGTSKAP